MDKTSANCDIEFRNITKQQVRLIHTMEIESFPSDEAEGYDIFVYRQRVAPALLIGCFIKTQLVGFICGTRYHGKELSHGFMDAHTPDGESVCIHSVVVSKEHRGKGIGLKMLRFFVDKVEREQQGVTRILLMSKDWLIPMYEKAGFVLKGKANINHGRDQWYEMQLLINDS